MYWKLLPVLALLALAQGCTYAEVAGGFGYDDDYRPHDRVIVHQPPVVVHRPPVVIVEDRGPWYGPGYRHYPPPGHVKHGWKHDRDRHDWDRDDRDRRDRDRHDRDRHDGDRHDRDDRGRRR